MQQHQLLLHECSCTISLYLKSISKSENGNTRIWITELNRSTTHEYKLKGQYFNQIAAKKMAREDCERKFVMVYKQQSSRAPHTPLQHVVLTGSQ